MKICVFTEIYDRGGIDTFIISLINNWPKDCDTFILIANESYAGLDVIECRLNRPCKIRRHKKALWNKHINTTCFPNLINKIFRPILRYAYFIYYIFSTYELINSESPDALLVVNGGYPGGDTCRAASIMWGLFVRKPSSVHNFHNLAHSSPWYFYLQEQIVDWVLTKYCNNFVTVSAAAANSMSCRPIIASQNTIRYIYNGLDKPSTRNNLNNTNIRDGYCTPETPLCLMLATYESRKGHLFLLKSFKIVLESVPDAKLLICGFGFPSEIQVVNDYVYELGLQNSVRLEGFRIDAQALIDSADILVVPSQAYESFGYVSVEAMSQMKPVVATNVGGIPEVVKNGEGGYCTSNNDENLFAHYIVMLLISPKLRAEQGALGYKRFEEMFSSKRMAFQYAELLHALNESS